MKKLANKPLSFLRALPGWEQLEQDLAEMRAEEEKICFLCYDIHSLRRVNRAYGRKVGDALLAAVAEWALSFPDSRLYRIEGDEFCLVFEKADLLCVYHYADVMESRFGKVWQLDIGGKTTEVFAQASIAAIGDLECDYRTELPDLLDQALKLSRKNHQITMFTAKHDEMTRAHVRLQMELKHSILSDMSGFSLVFQPIADPATGTWRGLEALCRWTGPTIGPVPPNIFIAEAEEMGLIHRLGNWTLDKAISSCKEMRLDKIDRFFISVNVSALQMNKRNYVRVVLDTLEKHRYPPEKLLLEITESTQFSFNDTTMTAIDMLRAKGVLFGLDDFGSGYSGFSNLKNLPVDILKTDRDFIENIENDAYLQYFYFIMSETAHASGMRLIAEGIETKEQLQSVVKNGTDLVQGYLFGRPMDQATIAANTENFTVTLKHFSGWITDLVDFKHWIYSQEAYKITPSLFGLQSKLISIILEEDNLDKAIDKILQTVGVYFKVNRAYVFLQEEGTLFSNRYEWCAEGVAPQKHLFQKVDGVLDGFYEVLCENEVVMASNAEQLPQNLRERLEGGDQQGSIQSLVVMPMKQHERILGFVGFDDQVCRDWMPEELIILHNLCLLCLIILVKNEDI
ncbi:EAL domain-containing protein [Ruminococcaceae bacterium OttesenSCG-928-I18]|nr:EAL domain-containing protein [Ruminococcaceae bacterium OttesenSCG-928-I18]